MQNRPRVSYFHSHNFMVSLSCVHSFPSRVSCTLCSPLHFKRQGQLWVSCFPPQGFTVSFVVCMFSLAGFHAFCARHCTLSCRVGAQAHAEPPNQTPVLHIPQDKGASVCANAQEAHSHASGFSRRGLPLLGFQLFPRKVARAPHIAQQPAER